MSVSKETTNGIHLEIKECQVLIHDFKEPILNVQPVHKITKRRQSVRLQKKVVPCMKEDSIKVPKKKPKKIYLNDIKESATVNNRHIISNKYPELSDNDIVELMSQLTSFIENGVFDDANMDWSMSDNDLNLFSEQNNALTQTTPIAAVDPESVRDLPAKESATTSTSDTPENFIHNELSVPPSNNAAELVLNDSTNNFVGKMPVLVQSECKKGFIADNFGAIDMSVNKVDSLKHNMIMNDQNTDSYQTTFENSKCCKCHKDEAGTSANTNNKLNIENTSTNQYAATGSNTSPSAPKGTIDRQAKIMKRRRTLAVIKPRQTFIQKYDLTDCSVNRKILPFKISKLNKPNTEEEDTPHMDISTSKTVSTQTRTPSRSLLGTGSNFDGMMTKVQKVLHSPCAKFLKNEDCGLSCPFNHVLIPATKLGERIKDWQNELIHFMYLTYIQRYNMCHLKYFKVICELFAERHLPDILLGTVKDCERFSLQNNFKIIFLGLIRCGLNQDEALFKMCINSNRSVASINKILEIIISFNVIKFKGTMAFLAVEIETYDFDPNLGNEIIRQTCQVDVLDKVLLEFSYGIIRRCHSQSTLNNHYMRMLLLKI